RIDKPNMFILREVLTAAQWLEHAVSIAAGIGAGMEKTSKAGALEGIRVLDLGSAVAAPFCAQILADHGADVIKIEPIVGDVLRSIPPFAPTEDGTRQGSYFHNVNRNKRSVAIDLATEDGRALLL